MLANCVRTLVLRPDCRKNLAKGVRHYGVTAFDYISLNSWHATVPPYRYAISSSERSRL